MSDQAKKASGSALSDGTNTVNQSASVRQFCLRTARHLSKLHLERAELFGDDAVIFSDPTWDILLRLYVAFCEDRRPIRGDATMKGTFPASTGLRTLADLEKRGLVKSERHPTNRKVWLQSLTERGVALMEACLQTMVEPRWRFVLSKV